MRIIEPQEGMSHLQIEPVKGSIGNTETFHHTQENHIGRVHEAGLLWLHEAVKQSGSGKQKK